MSLKDEEATTMFLGKRAGMTCVEYFKQSGNLHFLRVL